MLRTAILALVLSPTIVLAQAQDDDPEKVSNDQPGRPLRMPPASSEAKEAFDDFERFVRRGAWERATKALYAIPEAQAARFVDGKDGFIIPVARKRRTALAGLSPEGLAAYRLFYDDEAKTLLEKAEGEAEEATLRRVYSAYFFTGVGDDAADRLGDLYFEQGRFDRAADCWLALLRERLDSEISPALTAVKAVLALARAGRRAEIEAIRRDLAGRFAEEVVTLGGRKAKASEHLKRALDDAPSAPPAASDAGPAGGPSPDLAPTVAAAWQVRFGDSVVAGMSPAEAAQWETNALSQAVPAATVEGSTLFANYLGHVFAVDLATGKLLWRSSSFHNLEVSARQDQARMIDVARYAILAAPGFVWTLGRDLKELNVLAPFRLTCRRSGPGDLAWQSADLPAYAEVDLLGTPILGGGTLFVAAKSASSNGRQTPPEQLVLAIRPHDGKVLWKAEVGGFRQAQQLYSYYGMADKSPQPRLAYRAGAVYIDTHAGVFARLDGESGTIDWGFAYRTDLVEGTSRFFYRSMSRETASTSSVPLIAGDALLVKGAKSGHLVAIDPDRMAIDSDRSIAKSARLVGVDEGAVYLGGPELSALDRRTRALRWSTTLPGGSESGRLLVRPDGIWQLTPRGIFEVDPRTGRVRRIFRGDDPGANGGDLLLTDRLLLAITNRTISAYPRGAARPETAMTTRGSHE